MANDHEGVAVGCGWQALVAYINVGCYYVVGIPLGLLLGFYFSMGAKVYIPTYTFFFSATCNDGLRFNFMPKIFTLKL